MIGLSGCFLITHPCVGHSICAHVITEYADHSVLSLSLAVYRQFVKLVALLQTCPVDIRCCRWCGVGFLTLIVLSVTFHLCVCYFQSCSYLATSMSLHWDVELNCFSWRRTSMSLHWDVELNCFSWRRSRCCWCKGRTGQMLCATYSWCKNCTRLM